MEEKLFWIAYARLLERKLDSIFEYVILCHECGRHCNHFDHFVVHLALRHVGHVPEEV